MMRISDWSSYVRSSDLTFRSHEKGRTTARPEDQPWCVPPAPRSKRTSSRHFPNREPNARLLRGEPSFPEPLAWTLPTSTRQKPSNRRSWRLTTRDILPGPVCRSWTCRKALQRHSFSHSRQACLRSRSEEHTSELQSLMRNEYAVFCLKKKKQRKK